MVKGLEKAGIPAALICTLTRIADTVDANRIIPALGIPHPLGDPRHGRFALEESRPAGGAALGIEGTWTTEDKDTRVRLDPDAKSEPDRQCAIV